MEAAMETVILHGAILCSVLVELRVCRKPKKTEKRKDGFASAFRLGMVFALSLFG